MERPGRSLSVGSVGQTGLRRLEWLAASRTLTLPRPGGSQAVAARAASSEGHGAGVGLLVAPAHLRQMVIAGDHERAPGADRIGGAVLHLHGASLARVGREPQRGKSLPPTRAVACRVFSRSDRRCLVSSSSSERACPRVFSVFSQARPTSTWSLLHIT
jgi:hypothetical protein